MIVGVIIIRISVKMVKMSSMNLMDKASDDDLDRFQKALAKKVAYVVGDAFYPEERHFNSMRLNFSYSTDEDIKEAIKRLGEVIKEELTKSFEEEPEVFEFV